MFALSRVLLLVAMVAPMIAPMVGAVAQGPRAVRPEPVAPPVAHPVGEVLARVSAPISAITALRVLASGHVLLHDAQRRQLLLFEPNLDRWRTVADTTAATGRLYGPAGMTHLTPFTGDSTLIQDVGTNAFLVLDQGGAMVRLIPSPRAAVLPQAGTGPLIGYDQAGHLLFRGGLPQPLSYLYALPPDTSLLRPEMIPVRRVALDGWRADTIARIQIPRMRDSLFRASEFGTAFSAATSPIGYTDDAVMLADGTLAIVRARDYHIDWVTPDRRSTAGPSVPMSTPRLTDAMKVAIMDSVKRVDSATAARGAAPSFFGAPRGYVPSTDLPDHLPPFISGFARADARGRVWVLTSRMVGMQAVETYDIFDRSGTCVDRVALPRGASLVGLGADVLYYRIVAAAPGAGAGVPQIGIQLVMARMR